MGCGASSVVAIHEATNNSNQTDEKTINEFQRQSSKDASKVVKILLLGSGEGGKSTIVKQMRIIYGGGYSERERMMYRSIIYSDTIKALYAILKEMEEMETQFKDSSRLKDITTLTELTKDLKDTNLTNDIGDIMIRIWNDSAIQQTFLHSKEYQLNGSIGYFLNSLRRIFHQNYVPSHQDVLKTRIHTTGINETRFTCNGSEFQMIDVGGQKSQRKKWLRCFEEIDAIIFCASLSEYDQVLLEDEEVNRMVDSMDLYKVICNMKWFLKTRIILFLNKTDLLIEKIHCRPLKICFPEYEGENTYDDAILYIRKKFKDLERTENETYTHLTCATYTKCIQWVFGAVSDLLRKSNLNECGVI